MRQNGHVNMGRIQEKARQDQNEDRRKEDHPFSSRRNRIITCWRRVRLPRNMTLTESSRGWRACPFYSTGTPYYWRTSSRKPPLACASAGKTSSSGERRPVHSAL